MREQDDEVLVSERGNEVDAWVPGKNRGGRTDNVWVGMDGKDESDIGVTRDKAAEGAKISGHHFAEALTPVRGQDNPLQTARRLEQSRHDGRVPGALEHGVQGVNDGVARDEHGVLGHALGEKRGAIATRRREMVGG